VLGGRPNPLENGVQIDSKDVVVQSSNDHHRDIKSVVIQLTA